MCDAVRRVVENAFSSPVEADIVDTLRINGKLKHSDFYPKFGFIAAGQFGLRCEYEVRSEVFMAIELRPGALQGRNGLVRYQPEFGGV